MPKNRGQHRPWFGLLLGGLVLAGCSQAEPAAAPTPAATAAPAPTTTSAAPTTPGPGTPTTTAPSTPTAKPSAGEPSVAPRRPVTTAPPKKLDEPARTAGATVALDSVRATTIKASAPGDRSGPGVLVRVSMSNKTGKKIDTSYVAVAVLGRGGQPGTLVVGSPTDPVGRTLKAGGRVQGTYAFLLDDARSAPVTVTVSVAAGQPVLQFSGRAR